MKWNKLSRKQLQLLTWWMPNSPFKNANGVIAEGAIRSGKTTVGSLSYILWSMSTFKNQQFIISGKTIGSLRRNVITPLKDILYARGYSVFERKNDNVLVVSDGKVRNTYFLFGGRDERSQDLVQGITAAGAFLDEVALMPQSFVEQVLARCSVEGSKLWFNCNPEGPSHWFYINHVLKYKEHKYVRIHFNIEDNLSLSEDIVERYKNTFTGIFYERFILGKWAFADGVIYDCYTEAKNTYTEANKKDVLPISILENDIINGGTPFYGCDYGIYNPQVFLEGYKIRKPGDRIPYFYIENEYYYDGRKSMKQKTDGEYVSDFISFVDSKRYKQVIIDPSASSLIAAMRSEGIEVMKAKNDVNDGIRIVYELMASGHILINKDKCPKLISELGLYIWNDKKTDRGIDEPVKQNDHCCDALRYLINTTTNKYEVI